MYQKALVSVASAIAEMQRRRDHVLEDYADRLRMLEGMQASLQEGRADPQTAQNLVQQLLTERRRNVLSGGSIANNSISPPRPTAPKPRGPTQSLHGLLELCLTGANARIVAILVRPMLAVNAFRTHQALIGMLLMLRTQAVQQLRNVPTDVFLIEECERCARELLVTIEALDVDSTKGLLAMLACVRAKFVTEQSLLGPMPVMKAKLDSVRLVLKDMPEFRATDGQLAEVAQCLVDIYGELDPKHQELFAGSN